MVDTIISWASDFVINVLCITDYKQSLFISLILISRNHRGKRATYLTAEYHCGRLQSTSIGKLCTNPAPSPPFETLLELVLWNGLHSCRRITPDVINVIKTFSFQYFLYLREQKKVTGGTYTNIFLISLPLLPSLTRSSDILATAHQNTRIIDATQKETVIDQQQHSCETLICQCHQTILRFLSTAATASTRWRVRELYCQTSYMSLISEAALVKLLWNSKDAFT
jgi:hypothetical protein